MSGIAFGLRMQRAANIADLIVRDWSSLGVHCFAVYTPSDEYLGIVRVSEDGKLSRDDRWYKRDVHHYEDLRAAWPQAARVLA